MSATSTPGDPGTTLNHVQQELDDRGWRANWWLSSIWLIFLCFPVISVWLSQRMGTGPKVTATVVALAFAATYALGFRESIRCGYRDGDLITFAPTARRFLVALVGLTGVGLVVGGWAMLGLVPFLVSFAVFNLPWREAVVVVLLCVAFVMLGPLAGGVYDDLWVLTPVTAGVAVGMVLIRVVEGRERDRTLLQTELIIGEERDRVARDVHDVLGHSLTAVVLKAELAERLLQQVTPGTEAERAAVERCGAELVELQSISRRALSEIRSTVGGLRNPTLTDEVAVARTVLADAGVTLTVVGDGADVPEQYRSTLAWVVRESVINVVRHAQARNCTIEFRPEAGCLVQITDDGVGLDSLSNGDGPNRDGRGGNGLPGLRQRAAAVGAKLVVTGNEPSADGHAGTTVEVWA